MSTITGKTNKKGKDKKESKSGKKGRKKKVGKIEGLEITEWVAYTVAYCIGLGIISGFMGVYLPDHLVYIFGVLPFDLYWFTWFFGLAIWGVVTSLLFKGYAED